MDRVVARTLQAVIDLAALSLAIWLAFALRFEFAVPFHMVKRAAFTWPYVIGFQYFLLVLFGVTRFAWRYVGLKEATRILAATATAAAVLAAVRFAAASAQVVFPHAIYALVPLGVILIDFVLAFLAVTGVRALRRLHAERAEARSRGVGRVPEVPTLLVGAGQAGLMVAKEIAARPDLGIRPVGFVDDDAIKVGSVVHGIPVLGTTDKLVEIYRRRRARQVLITIASAPGKDIRRIARRCEEAQIPTKIIPGVYEIVGGTVNLSRIRKVAIEDLLGREPVVLDEEAIASGVRGRVVMVTGAGGSIGAELCRQACRYGPAALVLVECTENNLFHVHRELLERHPELTVVPYLADVGDRDRMAAAFAAYRPAVVFHAAAHKHVPMMEWNPGEAIKNNVLGTRVVADLADRHGVAEFVMISTDKAVSPTSVMGATKRLAEIYVQSLSQASRTRFVAVRFGNVLGSAGSVIPIFQDQIANGGPVTVTHPDMKRYFMTIPESCQLVLQAASMGKGGEIFILDMGEPVSIVELAKDLITLSGFRPGDEIEIRFTGVRPGEKLFEELSTAEEHADKTRHPKIFVGRIAPHPRDEVVRRIEALVALCDAADPSRLQAALVEAVPEYRPDGAAGTDRPAAQAPRTAAAEDAAAEAPRRAAG